MKLLRLDLLAFGPFRDVSLDLSQGQEGLHILYGPNEAGKSSSLRALRQLFFGFPARYSPDEPSDNFLHDYKTLRIGAKLAHSDGALLEIIRRKANTKTLRGPDDSTIVEPEKLHHFLGGIDQKLFETLFGIDHATLVEGGKEIVRGGGQFGEVLFAASAGLSGLRKAQEGLTKQMGELFLPKGTNPRINQLVQEYTRVKKDLKERQLSHEKWSDHARAFREAQETRLKLEEEVREKSRAQARRQRIGQALKPIAARKQFLKQIEEHRTAPVLPDDFSETRRQAQTDALLAARTAEDAIRALAEIEAKLAGVRVPEDLLAQADRIKDLYLRLGAHQKSLTDRPTREVQRKTLEHEAKDILRSLGQSPELDQVEKLRLTKEETSRIQNLGNQYQGLLANRDNARKNVETLARRIEEARRKLTDAPPLTDHAPLRAEIRQATKLGDPEEELVAMEQSLAALQDQVTLDLARLPYWKGKLYEVEKLSIPGEETVQELLDDFAAQNQTLTPLDQRQVEEEKKLAALEENIRRLELQQDVPTEENLRGARRQRSRGWNLVREAWLEGKDSPDSATFVQETSPGRHLADAYEQTVSRADDTVDRLRREADRVAQKATFVAQADGVRGQLKDLVRKRADAASQLEETRHSWLTLLENRGLPPLRLSEARKWFQDQAKLVTQAAALREEGHRAEQLRRAIAAARQRLGACLQMLGEAGPRSDENLAALLERAQEVVKQRDAARTAKEKSQENLETFERDLRLAQSQNREADQELTRWQNEWKPLMVRIGLGADAPPATANDYLNSINELFQRLKNADDFRRRIKGMDRDIADFSAAARALAEQAAPDLAIQSPEDIAHELQTRLARARTALQDRENLLGQQEKERARLREAQRKGSEAQVRLQALCQEATCKAPEDLPLAEERSQKRRTLERELHALEEQIRHFSAGATVEELIAEAGQVDADTLGAEVQRLEERLATLRQEISRVDQAIGSERTELERMDGNDAAADADAKAESLLAQLQTEVPRYAALHLASSILKRAVDRYREKNQGPVLCRASQIFAALSAGSFTGLKIDVPEDEDNPVLLGVRADGAHVRVAGMSDGSCDQLYLALRLATLEVWLQSHEPIPFIVDDILLNFDDERSRAALHALADLSRRTQVIFFTHHQHLVELGEKHLDPKAVFFHRLPGRGKEARAT